MEAMKDYVAHLDNKKRITLRGAAYQYYNVKEYGNGCIINTSYASICVGNPTSYYYNTLFYIICQSTFTYS